MKNEEIIKRIEKLLELRSEEAESLWDISKAVKSEENLTMDEDTKILGFISGILMEKFVKKNDTFNLKCLFSLCSAFTKVIGAATLTSALAEKLGEEDEPNYKEEQ